MDGDTGKQVASQRKIQTALEREAKRRTKINDEVLAATLAGAAETLKGLLDAGGDPNAGQFGRISSYECWVSALYVAASNGRAETVSVLLSRGADPNLNNGMGPTPLMTAARYGHAMVIQLLLEGGADARPTSGPPENLTALHYACGNAEPGCAACAELLVRAGYDMNAKTTAGLTCKQLAQVGH
jgi:hypothetical protein